MQFGSFMEFHRREGSSQADAFREAFDHIALAEELGLDAVWLAESHFNPARSVLSSPHAIASAIAARTKRLKVGTAVSVLPLGNPLRTAEEAATIDHISEGRFEFGVGRSGLPGSYEGYNIPYAESRERFYEYLDIILKAWREERFSYEGNFYTYNDVCLVPKPYQIPIRPSASPRPHRTPSPSSVKWASPCSWAFASRAWTRWASRWKATARHGTNRGMKATSTCRCACRCMWGIRKKTR